MPLTRPRLNETTRINKDGRLIRLDYVFRKPAPAARSNIISLIKRLAVYSFFFSLLRSAVNSSGGVNYVFSRLRLVSGGPTVRVMDSDYG